MHTAPIDRPGLYLTRNGEQLRITSIYCTPDEFGRTCRGFISRTKSNGTLHKQWGRWMTNGLFCPIEPGATRAYDAVAYVSA